MIQADPLPAGADDRIELSLRSSSAAEYKTTVSISSPKWKKWLSSMEQAGNLPQPAPAYSVLELAAPASNGPRQLYRVYSVESGAYLLELDSRTVYRTPEEMKTDIDRLRQELAARHFGKLLTWTEVDKLMPKGTVLSITDLETGLTFQGQRRAGSAHMDVQPLTKEDTAIMKTIYGGQWSWQRKAVLVKTPSGVVGASMHGMPHGGDGIPGNNFNGHFCIHFAGSITHGSAHSDPAHQAMAQKAAGQLEDYHKSLSPLDTVKLFLVAVNQKDRHLLELLLNTGAETSLAAEWLDELILNARPIAEPPAPFRIPEDALEAQFKSRVGISRKGARPQGIWFRWSLSRTTPAGAWFITDIQPEAVIRGN
jgi:hypothetical protein